MLARYIVRRLLLLVPVILGITFLVSSLTRFAPGDPVYAALGFDYNPALAQELRRQWGLDQPLLVQYVRWVRQVARGDLGRSIVLGREVAELIFARLPITIMLALGAIVIAVLVAVPVGVLAATHRNGFVDNISRVVSVLGVSLPVFWVGLVLLLLFALKLGWFPASGDLDRYGLVALVLPSVALGLSFAALIARMVRSTMLEVLSEQYITTAWAKGLRPAVVYYRHAVRNSMIPVVTVIGFEFGAVLGGAAVTETVFNIPGLGRLLLEAAGRRDYPLIQGVVLITALAFVLVNLMTDLVYALLDPRIHYA